jgi:hypothetical protein
MTLQPDGPTTIADVLFAADDQRVVVAVEGHLADDDVVAGELISVATGAATPAELTEEVGSVAIDLELDLSIEERSAATFLTLTEE